MKIIWETKTDYKGKNFRNKNISTTKTKLQKEELYSNPSLQEQVPGKRIS